MFVYSVIGNWTLYLLKIKLGLLIFAILYSIEFLVRLYVQRFFGQPEEVLRPQFHLLKASLFIICHHTLVAHCIPRLYSQLLFLTRASSFTPMCSQGATSALGNLLLLWSVTSACKYSVSYMFMLTGTTGLPSAS